MRTLRKHTTSTFQESKRKSGEHSQNLRWQSAEMGTDLPKNAKESFRKCEFGEDSQNSWNQQWCELSEVIESDFLISPGDVYPNRKVELEDADIKDSTRVSFEVLCEQQHEAFSKNNKDIGCTQLIEMEIDTGDSLPVVQLPYILPLKHYDWVRQEKETLEKSCVIERSLSRWASPVIIIPKKSAPDETPRRRLCVDSLSCLNEQTRVQAVYHFTHCQKLTKCSPNWEAQQFSPPLIYVQDTTI